MSTEKIALITDSTCDLPKDILDNLNINMLSLKVIYEDQIYNDRVDIQPQEIYDQMPEKIPTTSMPTPEEVRLLLDKLSGQGFTHAIAVHMSSGLSGTYNTVKTVAKQFSRMKVEVIDSKVLSLGLGFLVKEAAHGINDGLSFDMVVSRVKELQSKVKVFFVVKTLEYLKKGGRIGYVEATLGQILDIKPIISINNEGKYFSFSKVRGRKKSINKLIEILKEKAAGKRINLGVAHGNAKAEAEKLMHKITNMKEFEIKDSLFGHVSPGIVVHTGPGLIGLVFLDS